MTQSIVISLLIGIVLGQRFKMLVLVPSVALTLVLTIGIGLGNAETLGAIFAMVFATIASLQVGYLAGLGIRQLAVAARANRLRGAAFPAPERGHVH
jgi:hypothetical protein